MFCSSQMNATCVHLTSSFGWVLSLSTCTFTSRLPSQLLSPRAVFLLSVLHLERSPGRLWWVSCLSTLLCTPHRGCSLAEPCGTTGGEKLDAGSLQMPALLLRAAWWCRLQSGGSWATLSGIKALKLTKDCRAQAVIDKTRIWKRRSESFLPSPCALNISAVTDGCCSAWTW